MFHTYDQRYDMTENFCELNKAEAAIFFSTISSLHPPARHSTTRSAHQRSRKKSMILWNQPVLNATRRTVVRRKS